jgi:hypothetical protein
MLKVAKVKLYHIFKEFEHENPEVAKTIKYVAMDTSGEVFGYKSKPYLVEQFFKDFEDEEGYILAQWMPEYLAGKGDDDFYIVIGEVMCPHQYEHKTAVIAVNKKRVKRAKLTKQQKLERRRAYDKKRSQNPERRKYIASYVKQWQKAHPDKTAEYASNHYHKHKDKMLKVFAEWKKNNPDKVREQNKRRYERRKLENKPKPLFKTIITVRSDDVERIDNIKKSLGVDKRKKYTNVWYATDANDNVVVEMSIRRENVLVMVY